MVFIQKNVSKLVKNAKIKKIVCNSGCKQLRRLTLKDPFDRFCPYWLKKFSKEFVAIVPEYFPSMAEKKSIHTSMKKEGSCENV